FVAFYTKLRIDHILPCGFDHILFIAGLCLLSTRIKTVLIQASAFTLAHTVTLGLSMMSIIKAPSAIVEPIIALSIAFIAIENILLGELKLLFALVILPMGKMIGINVI